MNILVIPYLFPDGENDYKGIFVKDYVKAVEGKCNIIIFYIRLFGKKSGYNIQREHFYTKHSIVLFRETRFYFRIRHLLYLLWYVKAILALREIKKIDLIHVHGGLFLNGVIGLAASRILKVPVLYTEHMGGFDDAYRKFFTRLTGKLIYKRFDAVLIVSNRLKESIERRGFETRSSYVVYNPVDTDLFVPGNDRERNNLVYVGRIDKNKGALRVVEAFRVAHAANRALRLKMIGDGTDFPAVTTYIEEHPEIKPFIDLTGFKTKEFIKQILQTSSMLISPSVFESFGIAVAEAMSCGLPVIIGAGTGPSEFVDDKSGIAVDPVDINAIAEAILKINASYESYDAEYIRSRIVNNFSFGIFGSRLVTIYNSVLSQTIRE